MATNEELLENIQRNPLVSAWILGWRMLAGILLIVILIVYQICAKIYDKIHTGAMESAVATASFEIILADERSEELKNSILQWVNQNVTLEEVGSLNQSGDKFTLYRVSSPISAPFSLPQYVEKANFHDDMGLIEDHSDYRVYYGVFVGGNAFQDFQSWQKLNEYQPTLEIKIQGSGDCYVHTISDDVTSSLRKKTGSYESIVAYTGYFFYWRGFSYLCEWDGKIARRSHELGKPYAKNKKEYLAWLKKSVKQ